MPTRRPPASRVAAKRASLSPEDRAWYDRQMAAKAKAQAAEAAEDADNEPATAEPSTAAPEPARGSGTRYGSALAGLVVGLFAWGYAGNWIRGGQSQANAWFGSKFFNEAGSSGSSAPVGPAPRNTPAQRPPVTGGHGPGHPQTAP